MKDTTLSPMNAAALEKKAFAARRRILETCTRAGAGHIAPSFSCLDILIALFHGGLVRVKPSAPDWAGRDRFLLGKGHASVALYVVLSDLGFFPSEELKTFSRDGTRLSCHGEDFVPGFETVTGSLGHALPIGAGVALAARIDRKKHRTFVLIGDGECHEGSLWEGAMLAGHHGLGNLTLIVDYNRLSATDRIENSMEIEPLTRKFAAFGWDTTVVDGHSYPDLLKALCAGGRNRSRPHAVIARTVKGKGVRLMENKIIWHYRVPDEAQLRAARRDLKS